jgi:hypothetical protein
MTRAPLGERHDVTRVLAPWRNRQSQTFAPVFASRPERAACQAVSRALAVDARHDRHASGDQLTLLLFFHAGVRLLTVAATLDLVAAPRRIPAHPGHRLKRAGAGIQRERHVAGVDTCDTPGGH